MVAGGLFLAVVPLAAQQASPPHTPAARVLEHRKDLQLTDAQVKQLETLEKSQAKLGANKDSLSRADWDKARADAMAVLTPQQREKADSLRKQNHDQHKSASHSTPG
jgi:Spy/CpxP family protein refolding chaperone